MRIDARITYGALCKRLGVTKIAGMTGIADSPEQAQAVITLKGVTVDDDDAKIALIERGAWEDGDELADDPDALRDFITALLAGDLALARITGDRVFASERMRLACESALFLPARRAA